MPTDELNGSEDSDSKDSSAGGIKSGDQDAEGVWSPDIEQAFRESLSIYPPCGRRKIILSDCGKMFGRNELIARYIKLRTGKTRTRKQVSSHIQVLARRKAREISTKIKDAATKEKALQSLTALSSAQIVSATATSIQQKAGGLTASLLPGANYGATAFWQPGLANSTGSEDIKPFSSPLYGGGHNKAGLPAMSSLPVTTNSFESQGGIAGHKLRLIELSAFIEEKRPDDSYHKHLLVSIGFPSSENFETVDIRQIIDKFPEKRGLKELFDKSPDRKNFYLVKCWADLNTTIMEESSSGSTFYGVSSEYESPEAMTISCSTIVCSFGKSVVEKVQTEFARFENDRFIYRLHRSEMCQYMINFIHKLKLLPESYMIDSVLENFTILLIVRCRDTNETLLCIAFVFQVSSSSALYHVYRLVQD